MSLQNVHNEIYHIIGVKARVLCRYSILTHERRLLLRMVCEIIHSTSMHNGILTPNFQEKGKASHQRIKFHSKSSLRLSLEDY